MARQPEKNGPANPSPTRTRPATSVDVARRAGVSRATVSHVLNDQVERFSADTIQRVRNAAADLGYVRSSAGRALVKGRSDFIVVVVPHATFIRLQEVIEALIADIEGLGFSMVVHFNVARDEGVPSNRLQHLVETLRPAGVVDLGGLTRAELDLIERAGCPVLPQEAPSTDVNRWIGFLQAQHLHARGHTQLAYAFLSDARDDPFGHSRAAAVAEFCESEGLAPPTHIHVPMRPQGAERVLRELLELRGRPVGIACYNDMVALALVFAAQRLKLKVPADVALVGLEGADIGQVVSPRLTTVTSDIPAVMRPFRYALAQTYDGPVPPDGMTFQDEAFTLLPGETT